MKQLESLALLGAIRTTVPVLVPLGNLLPFGLLHQAFKAGANLRSYAEQSLRRSKNMTLADPTRVKRTLFTKLFSASEEGSLEFNEIICNAQAYIVAGSDTTANTLTYLVWAVCRHPSVKQELLNELKDLPEGFQDADLKNLPYLNQVINESLRLYGAAPSALPRVVPRNGAELGGYWLPEGTTVCTQAFTLHRDPSVFPDPEAFEPSRWADPTKAMQDAFMPFGLGSRSTFSKFPLLSDICKRVC